MRNEWSKISLIFLFIVALIGTLLRSAAFISIPLKYENLVHAHSHVAFQGWVYTIMFLLLTRIFLNEAQLKKGHYPLMFKLTLFVVIGILVSFSLQGYGLYSIIFSTVFQLLNYWFIYRFLKDTSRAKSKEKTPVSLKFIRTGLWLGVLSTIMPYAIGVLSAKGLAGTEIYQSFVYTFMHLQYNGWFLFVVLGLFFRFLEDNNTLYDPQHARLSYWGFAIAAIPAIALSLLGMTFSKYVILPAVFAATIQAIALFYFLSSLKGVLIASLKQKNRWIQRYIVLFLVSFILKTLLQSLSVFPVFLTHAFYNKFIIIAFLHLTLIGTISFLLIGLMTEKEFLKINHFSRPGGSLLPGGFILTETLLVTAGLGLFHSQKMLIAGSTAMAPGILCFVLSPVHK